MDTVILTRARTGFINLAKKAVMTTFTGTVTCHMLAGAVSYPHPTSTAECSYLGALNGSDNKKTV